jgi:hypothetical protein
MSNNEKYNFSDFTFDSYRSYLKLAKSKYIVRNYTNFKKDENYVLWRHDVDYSMHRALKLAKIEAEEEFQTTYFLHLHNEFYNLLESDITSLVKHIQDLGHKLGLHFDITYYLNNNFENFDLESHIAIEKKILEDYFEEPIEAVSFHNPRLLNINFNNDTYSGMVNAYNAYFSTDVKYVSDSFGIWRYNRLEDEIKAGNKRLQVLTHPEWWTEEVTSPKERIWHSIDGRSENNRRYFESVSKQYGLELIDWE